MHTFAAVSFRDERKKRKKCIKLERDERDSPTRTQSAENNKNKNNRRRRRALKKTTHQTPHAADDKPVGNPGGNRTDADESRERRSRIRSSHGILFSEEFLMVRPFPIEIALHFQNDDDAKRDDERWCAKRGGVCPRILCLLEERDDESIIDSFLLSSSV